jgi:hypothetical protein
VGVDFLKIDGLRNGIADINKPDHFLHEAFLPLR